MDGMELFTIFMVSMGISWGLLLIFCLSIWWFKRRYRQMLKEMAANDPASVEPKDSGDCVTNNSDSPPFPTEPHMVQPTATPVSYSLSELNTDSETDGVGKSVSSCPVQLQGTPSLYNARTGRQSFEFGFGDTSDTPSAPNTAGNSSDHETGILTVKKSDQTGSVACKRISSTDSEEEKVDVLKEPSLWKNGSGHDRSVTVETAVIERDAQNVDTSDSSKAAVIESQVPRMSSCDSFHGLPEMNSFDAYLHLTTVDTPMTPPTAGTSPTSASLTPRQLFFSDLIKQAEDNQTAPCVRKSVGDDVMSKQKATTDNRKSMPAQLHLMNNPESSLSSSKPMEIPAVAGRSVDSKDELSVADVEDRAPSSPTQKVKRGDAQRNVKNTKSEHGEADGADTKTGRDTTGGQFFIANVARNASVTSEVYLNIGGDSVAVAEPGSSTQWDLVVDDDDLSDDCVFEENVAAMKVKKKK
jgi:hypothetical protein